jgi:hypothetical protein
MPFNTSNNTNFDLQATYRGDLYTKQGVEKWIKQQWSTMVRRELEANLLMRQFIMNLSFPDGRHGDQVHIPTLGKLGVNTKQPSIPVELQKTDTDKMTIRIDQYKECSFMIEDIASIMLDPSGLLTSNLAKEAAYAINRDLESYLLGLRAITHSYSNQVVWSTSDGTNGASSTSKPFTIDAFLKAKLILDQNNVPAEGRVLIVDPVQYAQLLALDKVQSMFYRTSAPLENGIVGTLLGVPVYMSSLMSANANNGYFIKPGVNGPTPGVGNTTTNQYFPTQGSPASIQSLPTQWNNSGNTGKAAEVHSAIMMHRDAFVLAMLQEPKTEMSRETLYLADAVVTSTLYGARDYRPECAVIIHTNGEVPNVT